MDRAKGLAEERPGDPAHWTHWWGGPQGLHLFVCVSAYLYVSMHFFVLFSMFVVMHVFNAYPYV